MEMKPAGSWSPIGPADPTTGRGTALPSKYESNKLRASTKDTVPARLDHEGSPTSARSNSTACIIFANPPVCWFLPVTEPRRITDRQQAGGSDETSCPSARPFERHHRVAGKSSCHHRSGRNQPNG